MLTKMSTVLLDSPTNTTDQVEVTARAVAGLTQRPEELTAAAQVLQKQNFQLDRSHGLSEQTWFVVTVLEMEIWKQPVILISLMVDENCRLCVHQ